MPKNSIHGYVTLGILATLIAVSGIVHVLSPAPQTEPGTSLAKKEKIEPKTWQYPYSGAHVAVLLNDMRIELRSGTTTIKSIDILSKGKPGSYYETIGGAYQNDYKIRNHFSSLGEVYLPWSVHIFGNYFIHGVPYYPDGREVSSTYSGGCLRLANEDAKLVYEFVERGTPIVVMKEDPQEWTPTATSADTFTSMEMTRYMATIVSLEVLKQDSEIRGLDGNPTTRRELIPKLLEEKDDAVIERLAHSLGNETFIDYMNKKAASLGLTNTVFKSVDGAGTTTTEDQSRFIRYVAEYKSYLAGVSSSTPKLSR